MHKTNNYALECGTGEQCMQRIYVCVATCAPVPRCGCRRVQSCTCTRPISVRGGVWQTACSTGKTLEHGRVDALRSQGQGSKNGAVKQSRENYLTWGQVVKADFRGSRILTPVTNGSMGSVGMIVTNSMSMGSSM